MASEKDPTKGKKLSKRKMKAEKKEAEMDDLKKELEIVKPFCFFL